MESPSPLILELSSDEEVGFGETRKSSDCGGFGDRDDHLWLSELLGEVDKSRKDYSDEVVVISEVLPPPQKKLKFQTLKPSLKVVDSECVGDDDDDCVVLEGDPDKPVVLVRGNNADNADDDSDGVEIVGEKGEVACRDFPHPRHLCANFLFASTPHESHCCQCHCYVCDSLAPCAHWGTGISSVDHCHATDKEEFWRTERKHKKEGFKLIPVTPTINNIPFFAGIHTTQGPIAQPLSNPLLHNPGFSPVTRRPFSVLSNESVPNATNPSRVYGPGYIPRYRPQLPLVSPQLPCTFNKNLSPGNKINSSGNKDLHLCTPRPMFRRVRFAGASPDYRRHFGSNSSRDPSLRRRHPLPTPLYNSFHGAHQHHLPGTVTNSVFARNILSDPPSFDAGHAISAQPQTENHHPSPCLPPMASQPYMSGNHVNTVPFGIPLSSQPNAESFTVLPQCNSFNQAYGPVPPQTTTSIQPDAGNAYGYEQQSRSMTSTPPYVANVCENQSYQPSNPSILSFPSQNDFLQEIQSYNGLETHQTDLGLHQDASLSHGNPQGSSGSSQTQSMALVDDSQCQEKSLCDHHESGSSDNSTLDTNPDLLDFPFDSWSFDTQSLLEVPMSPLWNTFSPEPASINAGNLYGI